MICGRFVALLISLAVPGAKASLYRPGYTTSLTSDASTAQPSTTDFTTLTTRTSSTPTMTTSIEPLCESDPDFRKRPNPTLKLNAIIDPTCVSAQGFWRSAALRLQLFQDLSPDECIQKCSQDSECVMVQSEPGRYCNTFKGRLANILPINLQSAGPRFYEKECFECACL